MNSALVDLVETMTEEEREFTARLLRTLQDERGKGPDRVTPHRAATILKALGEDLEQTLNRRTVT